MEVLEECKDSNLLEDAFLTPQFRTNQGWHILRIIFKKSSPTDKIGLNWIKLDKSREKWIKLILTIVKGCKGKIF